MWNPFRRDSDRREEAKRAVEEAEVISQKIDAEISDDKIRIRVLREIREVNHLAERFDAAFRDHSRHTGGAH